MQPMRAKQGILAAAAASIAAAVAFACSSPSGGGGTTSACDAYFDALERRSCNAAIVPDAELARIKPRFEQICAAAIALPGSSVTGDVVSACASAVAAAGCDIEQEPDVCKTKPGGLAAGAACELDAQCQSGRCSGRSAGGGPDAGPMTTPGCGTCAAGAAIGEPCSAADVVCPPDATCDGTTQKCVAISYGDVGATCGTSAQQCKNGLVCDFTSKTCQAKPGNGQPCPSFECATGLTCDSTNHTCRPQGQVGDPCTYSNDCVRGLACSQMTTCAAIQWASAGQPCGDVTRCLVGSCQNGTCPMVIADGQPCGTSPATTCDAFARCLNGVCTLENTATCM